jgi:hypothetical protein
LGADVFAICGQARSSRSGLPSVGCPIRRRETHTAARRAGLFEVRFKT